MSDAHDWQELIDRHLRGELNESEKERLAELLDSDAAARKDFVEQVQWDTRLAEVLRDSRGSLREPNVDEGADAVIRGANSRRSASEHRRQAFTRCCCWPSAAVIIVALTASLYFQQPSTEQPSERITVQQPSAERPIAKITGLSGPLQWTGDGGRVVLRSKRRRGTGGRNGRRPGARARGSNWNSTTVQPPRFPGIRCSPSRITDRRSCI